jgi:hypothetical protein
MEVNGELHAPTALPPGSHWYPLDRRLDGPQNRSGYMSGMNVNHYTKTFGNNNMSCSTRYTVKSDIN